MLRRTATAAELANERLCLLMAAQALSVARFNASGHVFAREGPAAESRLVTGAVRSPVSRILPHGSSHLVGIGAAELCTTRCSSALRN